MKKKYKIIYVDPPWSFNNKNTGGSMKSGASNKYSTMSISDLKQLDVKGIADDDCVLFMWWVASQPEVALELVKKWGFKLKTMTGFNWVKKTSLGKLYFGMGFWTRAGSECCLIATRGNPKAARRNVRSVIMGKVREHSQKPDAVADAIVRLCGDVPRIEMFARDRKAGWDIWGNELENDIEIRSFKNMAIRKPKVKE